MRVLIAYATEHGATEGIAARIGDGLAGAGHDPDVRDAGDVADLAGYEAFVLGSAAYIGHWRKEAIEMARRGHAPPARSASASRRRSGPLPHGAPGRTSSCALASLVISSSPVGQEWPPVVR